MNFWRPRPTCGDRTQRPMSTSSSTMADHSSTPDSNSTEIPFFRMDGEEGGRPVGWAALGALLVAVLLPLIPHRRLRYYTCYISYVTVVSTVSFFLIPIFMLRPKNIRNLKISAVILKHATKLLGIEWELRNGDSLKEDRAAVVTANHQTILDILGMFNIWEIMDKCTVVAKKELLYVVPFGPAAWLAGLVFIDRKVPKLANVQLHAASNVIRESKAKFWMFPEGTRNKNQDELLPFKNGAFRIAIQSQIPIIPVVYSPYYFIDTKAKAFDGGKIIISVLDSISTEGMTLDDITMLKEKTYSVMTEEWQRLKKEMSVYQEKKIE